LIGTIVAVEVDVEDGETGDVVDELWPSCTMTSLSSFAFLEPENGLDPALMESR